MNRNTKANIFRGAINPIASAKQTIELEGAHATIQSHVAVPSLYINVDPQHRRARAANRGWPAAAPTATAADRSL